MPQTIAQVGLGVFVHRGAVERLSPRPRTRRASTGARARSAPPGSEAARPAYPPGSLHPTRSSTLFTKSALVPTSAKSCWHALDRPRWRPSVSLRCVSMKSTTTLRPTRPTYTVQVARPSLHHAHRSLEEARLGRRCPRRRAPRQRIVVGVIPTSVPWRDSLPFRWLATPTAVAPVNSTTTAPILTSAHLRLRRVPTPDG